jgi:subtilisin family serine protease
MQPRSNGFGGERWIESIELDREGVAHLSETSPLLRAPRVHENLRVTGQGITVALLDSGVDANHPDLAGRIAAEQCFTDGGCDPANPGIASEGPTAFDDTGHGTHVAGIIASRGTISSSGIAPGARLIAVRVLAENTGRISDWVAALEWLAEDFESTPFQVLNMSIGTTKLFAGDCSGEHPILKAAIDELSAKGVAIFASTGNSGSREGISAPACIAGVIPIAAGYDDDWERLPLAGTYSSMVDAGLADCFDSPATPDVLACFSNVNDRVELLAPGALITGPVPLDIDPLAVQTRVGTSQAAPAAAATAALMLEANGALTPTDVADVLASSGTTVVDRSRASFCDGSTPPQRSRHRNVGALPTGRRVTTRMPARSRRRA